MMALETVHLHKIEKISRPGGFNLRRNSTGKTDPGDSKEKVLSRYLSESISSCHDFCKYGTKEAVNVKERSLISTRLPRKYLDRQNIQQTGPNNSSVAKLRMSFASKSKLSNGIHANQQGISTMATISQIQSKSVVLKNKINVTKSTSGASKGTMAKRETVKLKSTLKSVSTSGSLKNSELQFRAPLLPRSPLKGDASITTRHRTLGHASHLKNQQNLKQCAFQEQKNGDELEEKTLYVIKIENGNKPDKSPSVEHASSFSESLSLQEDQEEYNFAIDGPDDVTFLANNATENLFDREAAKKHIMGETGKDGSNYCDDNDNQSLKLRFTRGKVVDMHSDNNSPRKLGFRRGRILGQNTSSKADAGRRSPKGGSGMDGDAVGTAPGPVKVTLKKQDVEDKKESKGLLNNVIEKRASELVKLQMSRVKALVGTFETLISLQSAVSTAN